MSLKRRLRDNQFDLIGSLLLGASGRSQVALVRRSNCQNCKLRDQHFQCLSCGSPYAAKSVPPRKSSLIGINEIVLERLLHNPVPEATVVYHKRLKDSKGDILLMDAHQTTLKNVIQAGVELTSLDWMIIMFGLLTRLANAHEHDLVHGDLKPSNVLLDATTKGTIVPEGLHITDFALIYFSKYKAATRVNTMVGTLPYAAPEILVFGGESSVTSASDVWAAGCIGFELCTGKALSHARGAQTADGYLENGLTRHLRDLSEIPPRFSSLVRATIERCLVSEASSRPTATQVRDYISQCIMELDIQVLETTTILGSGEPIDIPNNNNALTEVSRERIDNSDAEWQSISHADAGPIISNDSLSSEAEEPIRTSPCIAELTRQFAQEVTLDDSQEPQQDDFSWTTGNGPAIVHKKVIDKGASGEVHELHNSTTNEIFARKIIRPFGEITTQHIANEFDAVQRLCGFDRHKNLVAVLRVGKLPNSPYCYIDMERCELNLATYISRNWTSRLQKSVPFFISVDSCSVSVAISQFEHLMKDIGRGIAYIHSQGMIHRDLKPQNVLYSCQESAWKIADFGLTTEGTSMHARTTRYARGTSNYRAPEWLLNRKFSNKVDMWAMGCIFYEVVFLRKAFSGDYEVLMYTTQHESTRRGLDFSFNSGIFHAKFSLSSPSGCADKISNVESIKMKIERIIQEILNIDPLARPSATNFNTMFDAFITEIKGNAHVDGISPEKSQ